MKKIWIAWIIFAIMMCMGCTKQDPKERIYKASELVTFPDDPEARGRFEIARAVKWPPDKSESDFRKSNQLFREVWEDYPYTEAAVEAAFEMLNTYRWKLDPRQPREAGKLCQEFLAKYPNHKRAPEIYLHMQGIHRFEIRGDDADDIAFGYMQELVRKYPDTPQATEGYVRLGELYSRYAATKKNADYYLEAVRCYDQALERMAPSNPPRLEVEAKKAGVLYFDLKDPEAASDIYKEIIESQYYAFMDAVNRSQIIRFEQGELTLAEIIATMNWLEQAPDLLDDGGKKLPTKKAEALYAIGYALYRKEEYDAAIDCFKGVLDKYLPWIYDDLKAESCYFLACLYMRKDDPGQVNHWYEEAMRLAPRSRLCWPQETAEIPQLLKILEQEGVSGLKAHFEARKKQQD